MIYNKTASFGASIIQLLECSKPRYQNSLQRQNPAQKETFEKETNKLLAHNRDTRRSYLRVGRDGKLGGQADVGYPAFHGEGHRVGQGVLQLDRGCCALPDRAYHLDGLDDA